MLLSQDHINRLIQPDAGVAELELPLDDEEFLTNYVALLKAISVRLSTDTVCFPTFFWSCRRSFGALCLLVYFVRFRAFPAHFWLDFWLDFWRFFWARFLDACFSLRACFGILVRRTLPADFSPVFFRACLDAIFGTLFGIFVGTFFRANFSVQSSTCFFLRGFRRHFRSVFRRVC